MTTIVLIIVLAAAFELLWRHRALHTHRGHFRAIVLIFWSLTFLVWAGDAWGLLPSGLYYNAVPKFASDAVTYQRQALYVAEGLRDGSLAPLLDPQVFNYSRLVALLFYVSGDSRLAAGLFNVTFYMASVLSMFLVGRRLFDDRAGVYAAWLAACWPIFLLYETQTLRWVSTTAGLHLVLLGTVMAMGRGRVFLTGLIALLGFAILLLDMPQFARMAYVVAFVQAALLLVVDVRDRRRPMRALRVATIALVMVVAYDVVWVRTELPWLRAGAAQLSLGIVPPAGAAAPSVHPPGQGPNVTSRYTELPPAEGSSWEGYLNRLVRPILETRLGYLKQNEELRGDGIAVGTTMDGAPLFDWRDFVANAPMAVGTAFAAPTPAALIRAERGASQLGPYVAGEVIVYYVLLMMACVGVAQSLRLGGDSRLATIYLLMFTLSAYLIIGTVTMNGGTLHRFRLPYVVLHMVYVAPVLAALVSVLRQRLLEARR